MRADFELMEDGETIPSGRGGARLGAGRKPKDYEKPQVAKDFETAKARKEAALADMHELQYKIKSGEYVSRAAVRDAMATVLASIAQTLRSIPDNVERKLHVATDVTEEIEQTIDAALADAAAELAQYTNETIG